MFIFSFTGGAIYGEQDVWPAGEDHPTRPVSPYGVSKAAGELYRGFYRAQYALEYVALRYANVYGPRQNPHGEAGVVAIFSQKLVTGEACLINGDGKQTRDFVYGPDVARRNARASEEKFDGGVYLGTGVDPRATAASPPGCSVGHLEFSSPMDWPRRLHSFELGVAARPAGKWQSNGVGFLDNWMLLTRVPRAAPPCLQRTKMCATSASLRTSTTASRPWRTGSWKRPGRSAPVTRTLSFSTTWSWSDSAEAQSRLRRVE